jgi:predicted ATPase/class 3 adenylate cyclase
MAGPPTGTVTFLFTDIEGSTKLWERDARRMQAALVRHDEILKSTVEAHSGYVFKMVGDACCAAFSTTPEALEAAVAAQRTIFSEPWEEGFRLRVRMALHSGEAEERGGDYFGPVVNRVARLLSAGHGGQTLLSLATQELVRDDLPEGTDLRDLGERRLKDLFRSERVFQLIAPDLPAGFPPLKTLDARLNNIPPQPTPLVGREKEVAGVCARLRSPTVRLLTLTGPGGTGKTRLGLQVAAELLDEFEGGVFFVALAPISDPELVPSAIAGPLDVTEGADRTLVEAIEAYLQGKELLLVLDNFEQVVEASPLVGELLSASPRLKVLATSRTALRIYGEQAYEVPPLEAPDPGRLLPIHMLNQYEAVRLFVERAQAVKADFSVTRENAPAVAEICARLDGLPLAIELAAARIKLLPPKAMLGRLSSRLKLLTGGARDLPARQRTLRGTIEWSYDLLGEGERTLFARLAVFSGGRTLEAIEAVCDAEGDLPVDALDGVELLLEKSLLRQEDGPEGEPRFVMLETIHEYARERLEESGQAEEIKRAHAEYFLALAEEAQPELDGAQQVEWLERLEAEHDNMRAALSWSQMSETETALRLGGALWRFWYTRGYMSEGRNWLEQALAKNGVVSMPVRAKALMGAGALAYVQGHHDQGEALQAECLALYRELGDKRGMAIALNDLGISSNVRGDYERASAFLEESLELSRELGDAWGVAVVLGSLGWTALVNGDYERATTLSEESLELFRELGDVRAVAYTLGVLGEATLLLGDQEQAMARLAESLTLLRNVGDKDLIADCLRRLAMMAAAQEEAERAARLWGAVEALREDIDAPMLAVERPLQEPYLAASRSRLDKAAWEAAWEEGRSMTPEEAAAYALENIEDRA